MKPWLSKGAARLRRDINTLHPDRDKTSDGWIGDTTHSNRVSDHNPDPNTGVVRALDVDRDLDLADKDASWTLAEHLRQQALKKQDRGRLAYIIHMGQIASPKRDKLGRPWRWRPYKGPNPHRGHIHISFTAAADNDPTPWTLT